MARIHAHHILPVKEGLARKFEEAGLNINDPRFGAWVDRTKHGQISDAFEKDWEQFFRSFEDRSEPTVEEVLSEARRLAEKYDLEIKF